MIARIILYLKWPNLIYYAEGESMPRGRKPATQDNSLLSMALLGYETEKLKIEDKIRELRERLGGGSSNGVAARPAQTSAQSSAEPRKRTLSAAARRRIAAAQKKRWAEHRKRMAGAKG
jgi:cell division septum initiation protein DivIVA